MIENKKEKLFNLLINETKMNVVDWKIVDNKEISSYIADAKKVIQCIKGVFKNIDIYFVKQKVLNYSNELNSNYESSKEYYLIVKEGLLQMQIDSSDVSYDCLNGLEKEINNHIENDILNSIL